MTVPKNADEIRSMMKVGRRRRRERRRQSSGSGLDLRRARAGQGVAGLGCFWNAGPVDVQEKQRCQPLARRDDARALLEGGLAVGALTATTLF
jgi:hypothetical protein